MLAEMLTGRRQFSGDTVPHTLASVLKDEPNWEHFPPHVPPRVVDPQSFAATATPGTVPLPLRRRLLPWAVAAVLAAALGFVGLQWSRLPHRPQPLVRATILPPEGHYWYLEGRMRPGRVAISPDARRAVVSITAEDWGLSVGISIRGDS